jgi:hypothetical protein
MVLMNSQLDIELQGLRDLATRREPAEFPRLVIPGEDETPALYFARLDRNNARADRLRRAATSIRVAGGELSPDYLRWEAYYFNQPKQGTI